MQAVEIIPIDESALVLRAQGSELLIIPVHIASLRKLSEPKSFVAYFMEEALLNRPARKLFESWLRKDRSLWQRIYRSVKNDMDDSKIEKLLTENPGEFSETEQKPVGTTSKSASKAEKTKEEDHQEKTKPKASVKSSVKSAGAKSTGAKKASKVSSTAKPAAKSAAKKPVARKKPTPQKKGS